MDLYIFMCPPVRWIAAFSYLFREMHLYSCRHIYIDIFVTVHIDSCVVHSTDVLNRHLLRGFLRLASLTSGVAIGRWAGAARRLMVGT